VFKHSVRRYVGFLVFVLAMLCSGGRGQTNCSVSKATYDADMEYLKKGSPTRLALMAARYVELRRSDRGLTCTGVPLVAFTGLNYGPAGWTDDPGLSLFVTEVAHLSGLSLAASADILVAATVLVCTVVGLIGFLCTVKTRLGRWVGIAAFVLLCVIQLLAGDVYALGVAPAVACVTWIILFSDRRKLTAGMLAAMAMTGLLAQTATEVRSQAGTGLLLFALVVIAGVYKLRLAGRILLIAVLLLGMAAVALPFRHLYALRDEFLRQQPRAMVASAPAHVVWHPIYLGLSYIKNSDVPAYNDVAANDRVQELRPGTVYCSPEYEAVLKGEVFAIFKRHPLLVFENVFLKLLVVGLICAAAANVGLYAATLTRKPFALEAAFWIAIGFSALPGILVIPKMHYTLGLMVYAALYGVYSVVYAGQDPKAQDRLRWLPRFLKQEP
jgi:hypothetical protein